MKNKKISTIINYCSNEYRFIKHVIDHALEFSEEVLIPTCDHFYSSDPENRYLLNKTYKENPNAKFIEFSYIKKWSDNYNPHFWPNMSRWIGTQFVDSEENFILFLDADEVVDPVKMTHWLKKTNLDQIDSVKFLNYWYFREPKYQATVFEDSVIMTKKSRITPKRIFKKSERHALHLGNKLKNAVSIEDGTPMIHHYSWVRTKEEIIKKVKNWSHKLDRDNWVALVEKEFSGPFSGRDFVHNYAFLTVNPFIDVNMDELENEIISQISGQEKLPLSNVTYLNTKQTENYLKTIGRMNRLTLSL